jgi:predicted ATP-grasp superfamily ATP-dependent carboligase
VRALIVDDDVDRATLVAARDLAADGWHVGSASRTPSLASHSRAVRRWDPLPSLGDGEEQFVARLAQLLEVGRYDVVLTTWDPAVEVISRRRDVLPTIVPYGAHEGVATVLDKTRLAAAAAAVGIETPRTFEAETEAADLAAGRVVVKPDAHGWKRIRARICEDPADLSRVAEEIRAAGGRPIFQEAVAGDLESLALVIGRSSEPVSVAFQVTDAVWPLPVGVTVRAHTLPVDRTLLEQSLALLRRLDWFGLVQLQFLRASDGRRVLIDVNPRAYGSVALAVRAGARHPSQWARAAVGLPTEQQHAEPGVYYQWFTRDLRARAQSGGLGSGILGALSLAPSAAHSIWSRDEPSFAIRYFAGRMRDMLRSSPSRQA